MASVLVLILLLLVVVPMFVWWIIMLIEALKIPETRWRASGQSQILYVLLMIFGGIVGTILYMVIPRPLIRA